MFLLLFIFFFLYLLKCLKTYQLNIIMKVEYLQKKVRERHQNLP